MAHTTIVWLRLDLRLADHPALLAAAARGAVVPVYIWAPEEEGDWPPGAASRWWLHHSLAALAEQLAAVGSRLILRRGPSWEALREVVAATGADAVFWSRRYEPAAVARDRHTLGELAMVGVDVETFNSALLYEPWDLPATQVFTPFWRRCGALRAPDQPLPAPVLTPPATWPESLPLEALELRPTVAWAGGLATAWTPGAVGGEATLTAFLREAAAHYEQERDRPDRAGTSRLSPYLHFGELSLRRVWHAVHDSLGGLAAAERFEAELGWREFAHHLLHHHPTTPAAPLRAEFGQFPWRTAPDDLAAWQRGQTGYPLVDAAMRQLWQTGWMHNRLRMVVASFLTKDLLLDWRHGARWFWDTLVDADLANNTLGWQWTAGCGADAAPYFRIFNPAIQAERYDPLGSFVDRYAGDQVAPIVDHAEARKRALAAYATVTGQR